MIYSAGMAWISKGDDVVFHEPLYQKGSQQTNTIKHAGSWDILHHPLNLSLKETNLSHRIPPVHLNGNQMIKNLFVNMTSISQLEQNEVIETSDTEPWARQLDLQWEKRFEQREPPTKVKVI